MFTADAPNSLAAVARMRGWLWFVLQQNRSLSDRINTLLAREGKTPAQFMLAASTWDRSALSTARLLGAPTPEELSQLAQLAALPNASTAAKQFYQAQLNEFQAAVADQMSVSDFARLSVSDRIDSGIVAQSSLPKENFDPTQPPLFLFGTGAVGSEFLSRHLDNSNGRTVVIPSRPGQDIPGNLAAGYRPASRLNSNGNQAANRGQVIETRFRDAWVKALHENDNPYSVAVLAQAGPPDPSAQDRARMFGRQSLIAALPTLVHLQNNKPPQQTMLLVNVINPGTGLANLQLYLSDGKTVPFGGSAIDLARAQDSAKPGQQIVSGFGPHSASMIYFAYSDKPNGGLSIHPKLSVANQGVNIYRDSGGRQWQTGPVGRAMESEMRTYLDAVRGEPNSARIATLSTPLSKEDTAYIRDSVNRKLSQGEGIVLPDQIVLAAPRVFDQSTNQWKLDRRVFDALLNERPFDVVNALRGTMTEYAVMQQLLRDALEIAYPALRQQWAGMETAQVFSAQNRQTIRQYVNGLSAEQFNRISTYLR
jgi:hypothetical protein